MASHLDKNPQAPLLAGLMSSGAKAVETPTIGVRPRATSLSAQEGNNTSFKAEANENTDDEESVDPAYLDSSSSESRSSWEDSYEKFSEQDAKRGKFKTVKANDQYFVDRPMYLDEIRALKNKNENHS